MTQPIGVRIVGDNWFHDGWVSGVLGIPAREFVDCDNPIQDTDIEAWQEGYEMGMDTPNDLRLMFQKMLSNGQLRIR